MRNQAPDPRPGKPNAPAKAANRSFVIDDTRNIRDSTAHRNDRHGRSGQEGLNHPNGARLDLAPHWRATGPLASAPRTSNHLTAQPAPGRPSETASQEAAVPALRDHSKRTASPQLGILLRSFILALRKGWESMPKSMLAAVRFGPHIDRHVRTSSSNFSSLHA
jgi:hypothetical protein